MAIAIIPARLGSKGIPEKNFKPLAGISPVERAVTCCVAAGVKPYVSTDHPSIPGYWPFGILRPTDLAGDEALMRDVVAHALGTIEGEPDEVVLLVQPTQPLRRPDHLRAALLLMEGHESVASLTLTTSINKVFAAESGYLQPLGIPMERRQDSRQTYRCDGTVYAFRRGAFLHHPAFWTRHTKALIIPPEETAELDTPFDWQMAELRLKAQYVQSTERPTNPSTR